MRTSVSSREADERAVRAAEVGQRDAAVLPREPAVKPGDVAVLGEEHVAALAAEVNAGLGHGERVAGRVAADDERDAPDVPLRGRAEALDAVGRRGLGGASGSKRMISCPMRKTSFGFSSTGDVARELLVDAVERALVLHREAAGAGLLKVAWRGREVAVAGEDAAGLAADGWVPPGRL